MTWLVLVLAVLGVLFLVVSLACGIEASQHIARGFSGDPARAWGEFEAAQWDASGAISCTIIGLACVVTALALGVRL